MSEEAFHVQVAQYLHLALPDGAVWHHSPNEGRRGWKAQRAIKAMGVRKGWPDIEIVWQGRVYFVELKVKPNRPSKAQRETLAALEAAGCPVVVAYRLDEVAGFLGGHLPMKTGVKIWDSGIMACPTTRAI